MHHDLLPLPFAADSLVVGRSRKARRRATHRRENLVALNEAIAALNSLYGMAGEVVGPCSAAQAAAQKHLLRCVANHRPLLLPSPRAAAT